MRQFQPFPLKHLRLSYKYFSNVRYVYIQYQYYTQEPTHCRQMELPTESQRKCLNQNRCIFQVVNLSVVNLGLSIGIVIKIQSALSCFNEKCHEICYTKFSMS
jgi:hypothetical protein